MPRLRFIIRWLKIADGAAAIGVSLYLIVGFGATAWALSISGQSPPPVLEIMLGAFSCVTLVAVVAVPVWIYGYHEPRQSRKQYRLRFGNDPKAPRLIGSTWACLFRHKWSRCLCLRCGDTKRRYGGSQAGREHYWVDCRCRICGATRESDHAWEGCRCSRCGRRRDEGHDWEGCRCKRCQLLRDTNHTWVPSTERFWREVCGFPVDEQDSDASDGCVCAICHLEVPHEGEGSTCSRCGASSDQKESGESMPPPQGVRLPVAPDPPEPE